MVVDFLSITTIEELAAFFGMSYEQLARIVYWTDDKFRYRVFEIPKKSGEARRISSPNRKLKALQIQLKDTLYDIYVPRPAAHGFARGRSVATNAASHLHKTFIFNVDLEHFFPSIHFGRVKGLFQSEPFNFDRKVAIVLAQICCHDNSLPQGAPTSPIVANMVARKLDSQLQQLAKRFYATYTRYADDLTFSFTCSRQRLPVEIVAVEGDLPQPGDLLVKTIEANGFRIHPGKVRLRGTASRMVVTGITVNQFPNVPRTYVRQIQSMLYAWRSHGYEAAELEYNAKYSKHLRPSARPKNLASVVRGKLAYLSSVRGAHRQAVHKTRLPVQRSC